MSTENTGQAEASPSNPEAEGAETEVIVRDHAAPAGEAETDSAPEAAAPETEALVYPAAEPEAVEAAPRAPVETETEVAPLSQAPERATVAAPAVEDEGGPELSGDAEPVAKGAKDEFVDIAKTIFYALLIALVLRILFFQPFTIPSASMEPNLYEGDYIIVSKWSYGYSKHSIPFSPPLFQGRIFQSSPKRGDIVVFKLPRDNKTDYIKRVIGLPGDQIQMRDDLLYINGQPVKDVKVGSLKVQTPFGYPRDAAQVDETLPEGKHIRIQDFGPDGELDNTGVYTVPAGYYFMMGDNRDNSIDSRVPSQYGVGFVPAENLVGKAQIILFSWTPGASLWKPWTWFTHIRPSRFFTPLK